MVASVHVKMTQRCNTALDSELQITQRNVSQSLRMWQLEFRVKSPTSNRHVSPEAIAAYDWLIATKTSGNKWWPFTDDEKHQRQTSEESHYHVNAGIRLRSSCVSPVNAVPRGSQMESL